MDRWIAWLSERKCFAVVVAGAYLAAVIFFHKKVSGFFDWLSEKLSFKLYNRLMLSAGLIALIGLGGFVLLKIVRGKRRSLKLIYWVFTVCLVVLSYKTLVVFNVEMIHFPQYALLTLPVFALLRNYGETVFWVALLGVLDEAFQYFVLYRDNPHVYLDFNDIVLNVIGAGIGAVLIWTFSEATPEPVDRRSKACWRRRRWIAFATAAGILLAGASLYATGTLSLYPEPNAPKAAIVLSRIPAQPQFWVIPTMGKPFHIFHPLEGIFFFALLIGCYSLLDHRPGPATRARRAGF